MGKGDAGPSLGSKGQMEWGTASLYIKMLVIMICLTEISSMRQRGNCGDHST